jgi:hypothetical protein
VTGGLASGRRWREEIAAGRPRRKLCAHVARAKPSREALEWGPNGDEKRAMAKLTQEVQAFIVQQLACFLTPSEVAGAVSEEFGIEIGRQQAWKYTPANNPDLAPKWRAMFEATRAAFIAETAQIGIAHRSYRLRRLERYLHCAEETKRYGLAAQLLKQAAEESGGVLTNRRELTGANGGPLVTTYQPVVELPSNGRDEK